MHKILTYLLVFGTTISASLAQVTIEKPTLGTQAKAFAIIIDADTYTHTKPEVKAYQQLVEQDGLPTYIISGNFKNPDEVKKQIVKLYKSKQSLEGVVFIGEIPIALIRNAQHMTTAFKMNESKFSFDESSVPSDRFYDDLNLEFAYLKADSLRPLNHYYKLLESSPQKLNPSLYSARIRYPKAMGGNAHQAITQYLQKVVRTRRDNVLDHFVAFTGAAYNSECLVAWKDDLKAYKEDFPYLSKQTNSLKQLNFRMDDFMKFKLFDEMQRPEVDVLLMRKHGTPTKELINNSPLANTLESRLEDLRRELYSNLKRAEKRNQNLDSLEQIYSKKYNLTSDFFTQYYNPETLGADSIVAANAYIHTQDLRNLKTNPLYVLLDACYNGSFHEDDYIAGNYIFNAGNTIAAQGNTRNVLQDKWTMNQTGLLSYGVRLGQVHNLNSYLESHLIGDPTFHFGSKEQANLKTALSQETKAAYWQELLSKKDPIYQAIALRKLAESNNSFSNTLLSYFKESPYRIVRLQALTLLAAYNDANFKSAVAIALKDEYEMIARQAAIYVGAIGDNSFLPIMAEVLVNDKSRIRVNYNLTSEFRVFNKAKVKESLIAAIQQSNRLNKADEIATVEKNFAKIGSMEKEIVDVQKTNLPLLDRIDMVRSTRNYNQHAHVDTYLKLMNDDSEAIELRIAIAEAFGWYTHALSRQQIIDNCNLLAKKRIPSLLKAELVQTINRLK